MQLVSNSFLNVSVAHLSSWLSPSDVKPLPKHEIDAYLKSSANKKTNGNLFAAYTLAADPKQWIAERAEERAEQKAAEERRRNGLEEEGAEDEDELAEDNEEEEPAAKTGGKRKRIPADKKPTKKEAASKRAKTDKAPSKRVSARSITHLRIWGGESVSKLCANVILIFAAFSKLCDIRLPRRMLLKKARSLFPRRLQPLRPLETRRLPLLLERRLPPLLPLRRKARKARKRKKTVETVC